MPAVYGQDPTGGSHDTSNPSYPSTMYVEQAMELGVGATETVMTCDAGQTLTPMSTVDLKQLNSPAHEQYGSPQPGTNLQNSDSFADHYEDLKSPLSVASVSSVNSHVAYAEVANENIMKEIETFLNDDPSSIPVKKLRGIIPKMKMVTYLDHEEWQGKEKVKFLWENKPHDWPSNVVHSDPNNGIRVPDRASKQKPKKEELVPMFEHLKLKFLQMYKPEVLISMPMQEDRAESTLSAEPKTLPVTMTTETPAEDRVATSREPATPQPVPETGNFHQMAQLKEMVEDQCRKLGMKLTQDECHCIENVYNAVVRSSEDLPSMPEEQSLYIEGCCEIMKLLVKISCHLVQLGELKQLCSDLVERYGRKSHVAVKKEPETLGPKYQPEVMVYNVQAAPTSVPWLDDMESSGPICGNNPMLSNSGPYLPPSVEKFSKTDLGVIPFRAEKIEDLIKGANIKTRIVTSPDPDDDNVYPLPEKLAKLTHGAASTPVPTKMDHTIQAHRQQSIDQSISVKQEMLNPGPVASGFVDGGPVQLADLQQAGFSDADLQQLLVSLQGSITHTGHVNDAGNSQLLASATGQRETRMHNPSMTTVPSAGDLGGQVLEPAGGFLSFLSAQDAGSTGSSDSLNSFPYDDLFDLVQDLHQNQNVALGNGNGIPAVKPPPPKDETLPAVLDSFNNTSGFMDVE